jgi:hypothetical protein
VALQKRLKKDENNLDNAADVIHGNWPGSEKSRSENAVSRESGKREGNPWYEIDRSIQQLLDLPNALN